MVTEWPRTADFIRILGSVATRWFVPSFAVLLAGLTLVRIAMDPDDPVAIAVLEGAFALVLAGLLFLVGYRYVSTTERQAAGASTVAAWTLAGVGLLALLTLWFRVTEVSVGAVEPGFALATSLAAGALGGAVVGISVARSRQLHAEREQALADYEELFQKAEDGIFFTDPETGTFLDVNKRGAELYGYTVDELTGMSVEEITADDPAFGREQAFERIQRANAGEPQQFDWLGVRKDGRQLWVDVTLKRTTIGDEPRLIAIVRDVSERKRYEWQIETLHDATREMVQGVDPQQVAEIAVSTCRTVLGHPLCGVWLVDESADTLQPAAATPDGAEVVGTVPAFEATGSELIPTAYRSGESRYYEDLRAVEDVSNPDTPIASELIHPLGDHGVLTIGSTSVDAFSDIDRSLSTLFATNVEAALDIVARNRELRRQNEQLDDFASVVSHDLRNPLNVAVGRLELLREACDSEHLDPIDRALGRMGRLVDDLLTLARGGRTIDEPEPMALDELVARSWENVETAQATLETRTDRLVTGDRSRLRQLLENLIRNAVEHGGPDVTITVGATEDGFYVADDGPGIPSDDRERVFDAGYSTTADGTGFGLNIVREIARGHGWEVRIADPNGEGTRFEVTGLSRD